MFGANATMRMPTEPPTTPMTIHGRRIPNDDEVRSLMRPKNGLPTTDSKAPTPVTSAKLFGALVDADEGVDLQRQRHQHGREEHQAGAHVGQRVERDEAPPDAVERGRLELHRSVGSRSVLRSLSQGA